MVVQRTLVIIKPDGVSRGLIGEIISRIERKGLRIVALKMMKLSVKDAEEIYAVHRGKFFFKELIEFMTSGPIVAMIVEGDEAVKVMRIMVGSTDGRVASPGTIRGDYALSPSQNVVHASDSLEAAEREIGVLFREDEICS